MALKPLSWVLPRQILNLSKLDLRDTDPSKHTLGDYRVLIHIHDVLNNALSETCRVPEQTRTVFQGFLSDALDEGCCSAVCAAEQVFMRPEILKLRSSPDTPSLGRQRVTENKCPSRIVLATNSSGILSSCAIATVKHTSRQ